MVHAGLVVDRSSRPAKGCGRRAPRRGVTLVELLITMAILTILASVIYGATFSAMESARAARTRTTITKIHTLLMERWESYETRRLALNLAPVNSMVPPLRGRVKNEVTTDLRLLGLRELMRLEMPDRWSDVINQAVPADPTTIATVTFPTFIANVPQLTSSYLRDYQAAAASAKAANPGGARDLLQQFEGAECLYLVVMYATGDGEARELFNERDIGDTDGDGALEILDGWGRPIRFIRWPSGYVRRSALMSGDGQRDHDPFDRFRRDSIPTPPRIAANYPSQMQSSVAFIEKRNTDAANALTASPPQFLAAFRLVPLIFSSGADGESGLFVAPGAVVPYPAEPFASYTYTPPSSSAVTYQLGTPYDQTGNLDTEKDNITNHDAAR